MEDGNGEKPSGFKKILDFIKKNPAMSGTAAAASLYAILIIFAAALIIIIMQVVITAFSTLSGVFEKMFTSGEYKDMTLEEMQDPDFDFGNCYIQNADSWMGGVWDSVKSYLGPDVDSPCEAIALVKQNIKAQENAYKFQGIDLQLSPGLAVSTIIYGYASQPRIEGQKAIDPGQPMEVLADIVKDGLITKDDITQMVGNMVLTEGFWYYNCESTTCSASGVEITNKQSTESSTSTEEVKNGKQCVRNYYLNATFSREKYMVYLLYGSGAASFYEMSYNHNESIKYTCDTCYKEFPNNNDEYYNIKIDLDKYNINLEDIKTAEETETGTKLSESLTISPEEIEIYKKESKAFLLNLTSVLDGVALSVFDFLNNSNEMVYTYKDGFIYNKFPNYKKAFEDGTKTESQMNVFGTITNSLKSIASYEDAINKVYGLGEIPTMVYTSAKISVVHETAAYECPSEESCNCNNGNLRPNSGGGATTTADSSACSYLPINTTSETMVRLRTCVGVEADISEIMPGGTATIDPETGYYIADVPITLKRYIIGVAFAETGANEPVEGLKMQMLAAQTYLFNSLERGGIRKNSNGELLVKTCSTQFQAYKDEKVVKSYDKADSTKKKYFDDAYDAIKNQLVFDSRTNVTIFAEFGKDWTDARTVQANAGMLYTEMLTSSEVLNYSKHPKHIKNWLYGVLHTCTAEESATGAGTFVPDEGVTSNYKTNSTYNQQSQTLGIFGYLTYYQPDPNNRAIRYDGRWESSNIVSVKKDCGNGLVVSWRVHKLAKTTFEKAADGICQLTTTGIDGIIINPSNITFNGSFYPRKMTDALASSNLSNHSFGTAMDINTNYNVTVNGTTYKDVYEHKNLKTYESFVSALGSELDSRNVNYVLWKKVFQKLGFKWGGNWGRYGDDNEYDGMHFEIDWRQTK